MALGEDSALQRLQESARRDRDEDLADISRLRGADLIDSPEKKLRTGLAFRKFDARDAGLRAQRDAPDVALLAPPVGPLTDDPSSVLVFARVKEGPKELVARCGIRVGSTTTYLALVEEAVRRHSPAAWDRLQFFPVVVNTSVCVLKVILCQQVPKSNAATRR